MPSDKISKTINSGSNHLWTGSNVLDDIYVATPDIRQIRGWGGDDTLTGNSRSNIFVFEASFALNGTDTLTDFEAYDPLSMTQDVLDLSKALGKSLKINGTNIGNFVWIEDGAVYVDPTGNHNSTDIWAYLQTIEDGDEVSIRTAAFNGKVVANGDYGPSDPPSDDWIVGDFTLSSNAVGATSSLSGKLGLYTDSGLLGSKTSITANTPGLLGVTAQASPTFAILKVEDASGNLSTETRSVTLGTANDDYFEIHNISPGFAFGFGGADYIYADNSVGMYIAAGAGADGYRIYNSTDVTLVFSSNLTTSDSNLSTGYDGVEGFDPTYTTVRLIATNVSNFSVARDVRGGGTGENWYWADLNSNGLNSDQGDVYFMTGFGMFDSGARAVTEVDLTGTSGNDSLFGGANADVLRGEGGNDVLRGEGGIDHLYGGSGLDSFHFLQGHSVESAMDVIHDFSATDDFVGVASRTYHRFSNGGDGFADYAAVKTAAETWLGSGDKGGVFVGGDGENTWVFADDNDNWGAGYAYLESTDMVVQLAGTGLNLTEANIFYYVI